MHYFKRLAVWATGKMRPNHFKSEAGQRGRRRVVDDAVELMTSEVWKGHGEWDELMLMMMAMEMARAIDNTPKRGDCQGLANHTLMNMLVESEKAWLEILRILEEWAQAHPQWPLPENGIVAREQMLAAAVAAFPVLDDRCRAAGWVPLADVTEQQRSALRRAAEKLQHEIEKESTP